MNSPISDSVIKMPKIVRLKPVQYGEVLTTEDIFQKMKKAEENKNKKKGIRFSNKKISSKNLAHNNKEINALCQDSSEDVESSMISVLKESCPDISYNKPEFNDLKIGSFVLVDFLGGLRNTTHYKYVCCIEAIDDDDIIDIVVQGYERYDDLATEFCLKENDISTISFDMILAVLPEPTFILRDRKMIYKFGGSVSVFEQP